MSTVMASCAYVLCSGILGTLTLSMKPLLHWSNIAGVFLLLGRDITKKTILILR